MFGEGVGKAEPTAGALGMVLAIGERIFGVIVHEHRGLVLAVEAMALFPRGFSVQAGISIDANPAPLMIDGGADLVEAVTGGMSK
jgi:hypothetical protein